MLTRAKIGYAKPKALFSQIEPTSVKQALFNPHWLQAMKLEYEALLRNQTWTLTPTCRL